MLVLLPGLDGTGQLFQYLTACLDPWVEVMLLDYPLDTPLDYAALEAPVRSRLPQDRPFVVLGESFSGPLALSLAATPPAGLHGLILCCSFARNPRPWLGWLRPLLPLLPVSALPLPLLDHLVLGRHSTPALRQALAGSLQRVTPAVLRARLAAVMTVDVSAHLPHIRLPVLYLAASEDRLVPPACAGWLGRQIADWRILHFPAPHFLLQVLPQQAAAAIGSFMQELAIPAS